MTLEVSLQARAPIPLAVEFSVGKGELLALVGPSGAGKTSVLRVIAGLHQPDAGLVSVGGAVWLDAARGVSLPTHRRKLGMVFQAYALFPHLTAAENLMLAMERPDPRKARELLDLVQMNGFADRKPTQLSGGQQQRVAVARALAREPEVLLLDEPFSAIDRGQREGLQAELVSLRDRLAMPVVLVTHDLNEAQLLSDRMLVLDQGHVVRIGTTAEVMADPVALRSLGVREAAALLPARITGDVRDGLTRLDTATGPIFLAGLFGPVGSMVRVRIMAHEVILSRHRPTGLSAQNILPAVIAGLHEGDGPAVMVHLAIGPDPVLARITRRAVAELGLAPGQTVHVILKSMSVARDHIAAGPKVLD